MSGRWALVVAALILAGCGGAQQVQVKATPTVTVTSTMPGPTVTVQAQSQGSHPSPTGAIAFKRDDAAFVAAYREATGDRVNKDATLVDAGWNICKIIEISGDEVAAATVLGAPEKGQAVVEAAHRYLCP